MAARSLWLRLSACLLVLLLTAVAAPPPAAAGVPCTTGTVEVCIKVLSSTPLASVGTGGSQVGWVVVLHRFANHLDIPCAAVAVSNGPPTSPCAAAGGVPVGGTWCPGPCLQGTVFVPAASGATVVAYLVSATLTAKVADAGVHQAPIALVCKLPTCSDLVVGGIRSDTSPTGGSGPYTYQRESTGATMVRSGMGDFGFAACDQGVVASLFPAVDCRSGGLGAIIDVSNIATSTNYVSGTCEVEETDALNLLGFGPFSYVCGVDRDNDWFITNVDASSTAVGDKNDGSPDGGNTPWDDDFASEDVSWQEPGSVGICFRADVDSGPIVNGYPTNGFWDTFTVFIAINAESTHIALSTFEIHIDVAATGNGGCTPSSHDLPGWV
jgi:hypothetical protein